MNRDLEKGRRECNEQEGDEGMRAEVKGCGRRGGTAPALTSIFIYHRFPGKELFGEQARGRECSSHQCCTLKLNTSCYILHSRGPWQINCNAAESQGTENEVS